MYKTTNNHGEHLQALDGLRGLAILMVLVHHALILPYTPTRIDKIIEAASRPLWIGVDLFFVLSGFLITSILVKTRQKSGYFINFYARRSLRIIPIYIISIVIFLHLLPLFPWSGFDEYRQIDSAEKSAFWLYYINYYHATTWPGGNLGHFWTLCVEQHFYLFWPLVVWMSRGHILLVTVSGILLTTMLRFWAIQSGWWTMELGYHASHLRMDSLLFGALVYCLHDKYRHSSGFLHIIRVLLIPLVLATLTVLAFAKVRSSPLGNLIGFPVIGLTMANVLLLVLYSTPYTITHKFLVSHIMTTAGKYSYAIYIFHFPILHMAYKFFAVAPRKEIPFWPNAILPALSMFIFSTLLALISWNLIESRFLRLKRHFPYR
jgi:peptidoglycan/LPS O-acetylase OafA/YrhL